MLYRVFLLCVDGDIVIASTFFRGVYHYQGEFIKIVHNSVLKKSFLSDFAVIYTDSYLSLEILYLWHGSMNPHGDDGRHANT